LAVLNNILDLDVYVLDGSQEVVEDISDNGYDSRVNLDLLDFGLYSPHQLLD